tara:strand:- start:1047 stop:1685 length:639 start_codon:yes stop_codon:yes gene_type:complete
MPRKNTNKRRARGISKRKGILKKNTNYRINNKIQRKPGKNNTLKLTKPFISNDLSNYKRFKNKKKELENEEKKPSPDYDKRDTILDGMRDIYRENRGPFQSPEPTKGNSMYHSQENVNWSHPWSKQRREPYISSVTRSKKRKKNKFTPQISPKEPTRVRWGAIEKRSPSPPMASKQTRTWGQFFGEKLRLGKGTKKKRKKNTKGKTKGKTKR